MSAPRCQSEKGATDLRIDHIISDLGGLRLAADYMKPGLDLNWSLPGLRTSRIGFIRLEARYFMQEIRTGIFSSTGASFLEGEGAAPNLQKKGNKDDELKK
jgi:hypothetical protein